MTMKQGLPPVVGEEPGVLLLGSFPSEISLSRSEYYANPRNQAWRLLGALFGAHAELAYSLRIEKLKARRVALWDVFQSCEREGSSDSAINLRTATFNDLPEFLEAHPSVRMIGLNGEKAFKAFKDRFAALESPRLVIVPLPSSSPAHAAMTFLDKVAKWEVLQDFALTAAAPARG